MPADVVVIGGGPVGLITALGLARAGVPVTVLERGERLNDSPRAMVYHSCTLPFLDSLGILTDALAIGVRGQALDFRRFATGEVVRLDLSVLNGVVEFPYNLHLGQDALGRIALEHLLRLPNTSIRWNTEVTAVAQDGHSVTVTVNTPDGPAEHRAAWAVAADGARSGVREALGLEFEGMTWSERFVATNIRYDFSAHGFDEANMVVDPTYGAIVAQIDDNGLWRCTFSEDDSLPLDSVEERIAAYMAAFLPDPTTYELVHYAPYKMHQRAATSFRAGRVFLAGDAAHATNPTGGMGLTSGLFDAETLHEALAAVIHGEVPDSVLDRYTDRRRAAFLDVASPMASQFKQLVYSTSDSSILDEIFAGLRAASNDVDLSRKHFLDIAHARTGSLLDEVAAAE